jgi:carboxyl-terminal processing protease
LDYSNRKDGESAKAIEEEQITYFETKNGRKVRDARGIDPDIAIEEKSLSRLTATLFIEQLIFDFATDFAHKNTTVAPASKFQLNVATFDEFKRFVKEKKVEYKTESEELLEKFIASAENENLLERSSDYYLQVKNAVSASLERDLEKNKTEILELLENEIVSRYYFQKGRLEHSFLTDIVLKSAIQTLDNKTQYVKILSGI